MKANRQQPTRGARVDAVSPPGDRYATLYHLAPVGYVTLDATGRVEEINETGARLLGWTPAWLCGKPLSRWILAEDLAAYESHLRDIDARGRAAIEPLRLKNRHGRFCEVRLESVALGDCERHAVRYFLVMLDVSEDQRGERQVRADQARLWHASRINLMGTVASNLAHELNQPLGAMLLNSNACLQMLDEDSPALDDVRDTLQRICDAASYAGSIVGHLRAFLRRAERARAPTDLNAIVHDALLLADADRRDADVAVSFFPDPLLPPIEVDAVEIEQVLLNLVRNGIDAMNEAGSTTRRIEIRTGHATDGHIAMRVADTGPGIPPSIASQVFDPFFSTKPDGMGLGLAISRSIVEAHRGRLALESSERGACFVCSFPPAARAAS